MQKTLGVLGLVALLALASPLSSASAAYDDVLSGKVTVLLGPQFVPSNPVLQASREFDISLGVGDTVSASLTYVNTGTTTPNDLDLTLLLPSEAPVPVNLGDPIGTATRIVQTRVARTTCTDAAAESAHHPLLGGSFDEALGFTVPSGGETGSYALIVRGFSMSTDQPYTLTITVTSGGSDVSASRVSLPVPLNTVPTTLITTNPYCGLV